MCYSASGPAVGRHCLQMSLLRFCLRDTELPEASADHRMLPESGVPDRGNSLDEQDHEEACYKQNQDSELRLLKVLEGLQE